MNGAAGDSPAVYLGLRSGCADLGSNSRIGTSYNTKESLIAEIMIIFRQYHLKSKFCLIANCQRRISRFHSTSSAPQHLYACIAASATLHGSQYQIQPFYTQRSSYSHKTRAMKPIVLDGRTGEGGGQLVRLAVALAAITSQSVKITSVRGNRPKDGQSDISSFSSRLRTKFIH